ncbi:protein translocase subunit SecD [Brevibacterium luteolum]|uniref:Protein translocase subunit SecD n=1 Tax=Brevibacterium luteolum TaxID=199591 RepID=A0A6G8KTY9_9MICO|nr:protein translocase subunit SecD [Brevibacterium luteolum]QIN28282.1 protein translocase subunit SecD [Brevibacterium luteolum]
MSTSADKPRPGLRFAWLTIFTLALVALIGGGAIWSNASWTPKLALDLEGGTSIILEPQLEDQRITQEQLEQAVAIIRQRVDSTGVSEAEITTQGDRNIIVNLPGNPDEQTRELVRSSAQMVFRRVAVVAPPEPDTGEQPAEEQGEEGNDATDEEKKQLEELLKDQGNEEAPAEEEPAQGGAGSVTGTEGADVTAQQPSDAGTVPGPAGNPGDAEDAESGQGTVKEGEFPRFDPQTDQSWLTPEILQTFQELDCTKEENRVGGETAPDDQPVVACDQSGAAKYVLGPVEFDGSHITDAEFTFETTAQGAQTNRPAVSMTLDNYGAEAFSQISGKLTGLQEPYSQFAMVLDGQVLSAPRSQAHITDGRMIITGQFTVEEAETLASQLKNGSLPISFQVQSEQQISPTLGADYLAKGLLAGGIGLLLVVGYSLIQYRVLGLVTVSSLAVAGVLTYLLLLFVTWRYGYRLSLAGVAGLIVGIGMTADSFIVYFERIRDELRSGRKLTSAVEIGWDRAKRTIFASKAVNMLAAVILYILAVGSVRGFAFTLGLTVIVDVILVVLFTHPMMQVLARTHFFGHGHPWSGMDPRQLGVKMAAYRGAMGLDLEKAKEKSKKRGSYKEAKRRQASIEKRSGSSTRASRKSTGTLTADRSELSIAERKALREKEAREREAGVDADEARTDSDDVTAGAGRKDGDAR